MGALRWTALLVAGLLLAEGGSGSSSHSLRYFYTSVSEPGQELPRFVTAGYVDGQLFTYYDSHTRREMPAAPWAEKLTQEDPQYWEQQTQMSQGAEAVFRVDLSTLRERYNQSAGLHTLQYMSGCEVGEDGRRRGRLQYGYEGRDFISFDKDHLRWTAADPPAGITQRKWDALPERNAYKKAYLEEICIDWLRRYLRLGKESLLRKVPPQVKVTHQDSSEGLETLLCQAHGFYPKEIDIAWRKDGEVWVEDTFHGGISPNADGTYYTWHSITIDPKDRARYRCHVDHDGLLEPLDLAVEKSVLVWVTAVGLLSAVVVLLLVVAGILCVIRNRAGANKGHEAPPGSPEGSDSSVTGGLLLGSEKRAETPYQSQAGNSPC